MFRPKRSERDFNSEIKAHIDLEVERLREQGLSEEASRAAARRAFGNVTQAQERFYESGRFLWFDCLRQDLRFAFRMLRKSPGFTFVAVVLSDFTRSAGPDWRSSGDGPARPRGDMDSRATRIVNRSRNPAPRRVNSGQFQRAPADRIQQSSETARS